MTDTNEERQIELAKQLLEGKGYTVSERVTENSSDDEYIFEWEEPISLAEFNRQMDNILGR